MLPEVGYSEGMFNVLTMSHVIEHVPDPLAHLSECWRILAPGGQLIVRTPNMASFASRMFGKDWTALDPPRHLVLFTPSSLHACVERVGFHVIRERSHAYLASFHAQMSLFIRQQGHARGLMDVSNVGPLARFLGQVEHMLLPIWRWAGNELRLVSACESASTANHSEQVFAMGSQPILGIYWPHSIGAFLTMSFLNGLVIITPAGASHTSSGGTKDESPGTRYEEE
jgi:Methyltransferase domain